MIKITIGHLYPKQLNLYGDRGNIEALTYRAEKFGILVKIVVIDATTKNAKKDILASDILFMGGGPDSMQKEITDDFMQEKGEPIKEYYNNNGVGLFVCGAYQLLGKYYRPFSGKDIPGLSLFDFYTEHFGINYPRCVGNVVVDISGSRIESSFSKFLVGFENHGGRSFLNPNIPALGRIVKGIGNNEKQKTEGLFVKNFIGTYLHGPILPKNPHLTDFLLASVLQNKGIKISQPAYDRLETLAHQAALRLKK